MKKRRRDEEGEDPSYDEEPDWANEEPQQEEEEEEDPYQEEPTPSYRRRSEKKSRVAPPQDYSNLYTQMPGLARPPLQPLDPAKDSLAIQLLEGDYEIQDHKPVIRLFGVTAEGNSVMACLHGYTPYFYVPAFAGFTQAHLDDLGRQLNAVLMATLSKRFQGMKKAIMKVDVVERQSIWGYQANGKRPFVRIETAVPPLVPTARKALEAGLQIQGVLRQFQTFESNVPFILRFMIDKDARGGGWAEFPANKYTIRPESEKTSRAQLEIEVAKYDDMVVHASEGVWLKIAPLRVLSFDIECAGKQGHFPKADADPVIQIASVLSVQAATNQILLQSVHVLNTCAAISGVHILSHAKEADMMMAWLQFFQAADPDVVTGYNIMNFDFPYLLDRAKALGIDKRFPYFGRITKTKTRYEEKTFQSKAYGKRKNKETALHGRVLFDVLPLIRRDFKLRSYTLNAVSAHFLGAQKEDVHHTIITKLQNDTDETRRRLASYCLKDALLPVKLVDKLMLLINAIEMCRVTGVPLPMLLVRGQQIRVVSQLYRKAKEEGYLIPILPKAKSDSNEKYEGATVLEPKTGFYEQPIATLDFASLYPSIMMAHNLCYTTLLTAADAAKLQPDQVTQTPKGALFVKSSVREGLLPRVLKGLLDARALTKRLMKDEKDPFRRAVLDGRQLALKIGANSVYGFTGATIGQLPCIPISEGVTSFGREMIEHSMKVVQKNFTIAKGYEFDADVIYGDTDSIMVKFGTDSVAESMRLGAIAAQEVSKEFIRPIKLEFEKVYWPYLLMNKKRYAGLYWTNPNKWDKLDSKGIETVRRDNCGLVKDVVETCLNKILIDRNVKEAVLYAKKIIQDLWTGKIGLAKLVISKSLGKSAEDYDAKVAHVELAARMRKRDPATAPVVGDRVSYVVTQGPKGAKIFEKVEDPIWVLKNKIPIDASYYLDHQLHNPLTRIFEPIIGPSETAKIFVGQHTLKVKKVSGGKKGIMKFAVKQKTCFGCKVPLGKQENGAICARCEPKTAEIYIKQMDRVREHEERFSKLWTHCQRCQGSMHQEVICNNQDCPIWYAREEERDYLDEAHKALELF